jgi:anti-anti-sigma regulatory factor
LSAGLLAKKPQTLDTLIVDFTNVSGLDSAACAAIAKFGYLARRNGFSVTFAAVPQDVCEIMERWGIGFSDESPFIKDNNLDQALEKAEDKLLAKFGKNIEECDMSTLLERLTRFDPRGKELFDFMEPIEMSKGEVLITSGSASGDIYFLEKGCVSVWIADGVGGRMRVRSMRRGAVVGEAGFARRVKGRARQQSKSEDIQGLLEVRRRLADC